MKHIGTLLSGNVTCSCGWESGHHALASDAEREFANHARRQPRTWVGWDLDRQVMVTVYHDGSCDVAYRREITETWSAPVHLDPGAMTTERFEPDDYGTATAVVPGKFRFAVAVTTHQHGWAMTVGGDDQLHELEEPIYKVSLPHQCDRWEITDTEYGGTSSKGEAAGLLRQFIAEANDALAVLEKAP